MLIIVVRTLILYALVVIALRVMGKREIAQLQPFELVVLLMIADLAVIPSENVGIPLLTGIIPILVLLAANLTLAWITLKSEKARDIICGTPSILIWHGKIDEEELRKNCYNLTDLLEELRIKNVPNIADVEYAILENNGDLSVFHRTLYEGLPLPIILDGQLNIKNLQQSSKDLNWLKRELKKRAIDRVEDVFLASLDTTGKLFIQAKTKAKADTER
ncbi:MAG TPA: DUF421 domain-containing protein [Desulfosporosinus sp.]|nr:DUF421 domain-containing protein [Desulfosporosinus sp.]